MTSLNDGDAAAPRDSKGTTDLDSILFQVPPAEYGEEPYRAHLLDQYKLFTETADRTSARRQTANAFFVTVNTALLAFIGLVVEPESKETPLAWMLAVSVAGIVICYAWYRLVRSYRGLNSGKFKVIRAMERHLPAAPFDAEWEAVGRGKDPKRLVPFTRVEQRIPWIFAALYLALAAWHVAQEAGWT